MKILTLFARHGTDKYPDAFSKMHVELSARFSGCDLSFVVIDSAQDPAFHFVAQDGVLVIGSDNSHWEFGSWMAAVRYFGMRIFEYDYIHLVTSAFYFGYIDFKNYITEAVLRRYLGRAVALGHIESYNEPVSFFGVRFQSWLRSSFIFISPSELKMLGDLVTVHDRSGIFSDDPAYPFIENGGLCAQYKQNLYSWLTGDGTGQGVAWHSRFELDESNLSLFKNKAVAIMNEMMLSNRLISQGCSLVDLTWLHRNGPLLDSTAPIPSWHQQVITRGTGHELLIEGVF